MMRWDLPFLVWFVPVGAVALGGLALIARGVRIRRARRWSEDLAGRARRFGRFGWLVLALAGGAALSGIAGPRWGSRVVETETKGLNIVLAVDVSRSMLATDVAPSRLERAKEQARRLVYQQRGDRIGLIAYAGNSFILSPLTVDASALLLLIDALDPDLLSTGGTELGRVLRQGRELLFAGDPIADRVLVLFTDGEGHDSLTVMMNEAATLRREGVRLVVVAEGGTEPVPIPITDPEGNAIGRQRDPAGEVVETQRRDDLINAIADEARGVVVPAGMSDQAGAVRELIAGYVRVPQASSTADEDISRAWIPALVAAMLVLIHTLTRRSLALAALALCTVPVWGHAQGPVNAADAAWIDGDFRTAAEQYLRQVREGEGGERTWYNLGTAALAIGDTATARRALTRTAASLDPELRFRSLYNLALLRIRQAAADSQQARGHLEEAFAQLREALLLKPEHRGAKWNLELVLQRRPPEPPNQSGGGSGSGGGGAPPPEERSAELTPSQAEQILNSMAEEERRAMLDRTRRSGSGRETRGWKEW
jgi:Ca-activated chloride channel family protein